MGKLQSDAKRNWWSNISPEERSKIMSARMLKHWAKKSKEERLKKGAFLKQARLKVG